LLVKIGIYIKRREVVFQDRRGKESVSWCVSANIMTLIERRRELV